MVENLTDHWGSLDILVNNAGAPGQGYGSLKKVTKARFVNTLDINLTSAYTLTHLALPLLQAAPSASIVNVSSASDGWSTRTLLLTEPQKAGMDQMTRILAYELAPSIRVNGIAPGPLKPQVPPSSRRTRMCTTPPFAGSRKDGWDNPTTLRWPRCTLHRQRPVL